MSQYQRLLLIAGPAMRHTPALERAVAIAEVTGAALHITVFIEDSHLFGLKSAGARFREACQQENEQWLKDESDLIRARGLTVTTQVLVTRTALQEILVHVAEMQPDLVIKDVQHESALTIYAPILRARDKSTQLFIRFIRISAAQPKFQKRPG